MKIFFISTHFDDAVWSTAGRIKYFKMSGYTVIVITVFTNYPNNKRQVENLRALELLNVEHINLNYLDATYRKFKKNYIYTNRNKLLGKIHHCDLSLIQYISDSIMGNITKNDIINAPIGNSTHVDHKIVKKALDRLDHHQILWFEEFPYMRLASYPEKIACLLKINFHDWLTASLCYKTQIQKLFKNENLFGYFLKKFAQNGFQSIPDFYDKIWFNKKNKSLLDILKNRELYYVPM